MRAGIAGSAIGPISPRASAALARTAELASVKRFVNGPTAFLASRPILPSSFGSRLPQLLVGVLQGRD